MAHSLCRNALALRQVFAVLCTSILLNVLPFGITVAEAQPGGITVVDVERGSEAQVAGLRSGDRLIAWRRTSGREADDRMVTPFDLSLAEVYCAAKCEIEFQVERGGQSLQVRLQHGDWGLAVIPSGLCSPLREATHAASGAPLDCTAVSIEALSAYRQALDVRSSPDTVAWVNTELVIRFVGEQQQREVEETVGKLEIETTGDLRVLALRQVLESGTQGAPMEIVWPIAEALQRALTGSDVASAVAVFGHLAMAEFSVGRGRLGLAKEHLDRTEALLGGAIDNGISASRYHRYRAEIARISGELDDAIKHYQLSLEALERVAGATGRLRVPVLRGLGIVETIAGNYDNAWRITDDALQLAESFDDTTLTAKLLNNLGILHARRGDMARAEYHYERAMTINRDIGAWLSYSYNLANLADIATARGDHNTAESLLLSAQETIQSQSPDSTDVALVATILAHAQFGAGKLDSAKQNYLSAIESYERLAPDSPELSHALLGLGDTLIATGELDAGLARMSDAIAIRKRLPSANVELAEAYYFRAKALHQAGRIEEAIADLGVAEPILERMAPDSAEYAAVLHQLALIARDQKDPGTALERYEAAVSVIERQMERLGGVDDARSAFADRHAPIFKEYAQLLLQHGQATQAFEVLERYRVRTFLALLAEREAVLDFGLPKDLAAQRRAVGRDYDSAQLALIEAADDAEAAEARQHLAEVRVSRNALNQRLRSTAAEFSRLRYPVPLSLEDAQNALAPGTLCIAYAVLDDQVVAFLITGTRFEVVELNGDAATLNEDIQRFRHLLDGGRHNAKLRSPLVDVSRRLHDKLVTPIGQLDSYQRLLIIPDGPLHSIPFAALATDSTIEHGEIAARFLVEEIPVHSVASLTLYQELLHRNHVAPPQRGLVAFADPTLTTAATENSRYVPTVLAEARQLAPLPWAREEVTAIAELAAADSSIFLGRDATEKAFFEYAPQTNILHMATHAIIDESSPLDSSLVLALEDDVTNASNGLVQSWEVLDRLQLRADLVVLSACESGVGPKASGEGLLGLQRSFLHAGARSILSSQWRIPDRSTSYLMREFYRELGAGTPVDVALQRAQIALLRGTFAESPEDSLWQRLVSAVTERPDYSHPYFWAAFTLTGDFGPVVGSHSGDEASRTNLKRTGSVY